MILNLSEDDFKLIRITCQAACHALVMLVMFVRLNKRAKLLSSYLPVSPSRVLRAPGTSPYHLVRSTFGPRGPGLRKIAGGKRLNKKFKFL